MKFGYYVRTVLNYPEIRDLTLRVEKLGFDSVHINDEEFHQEVIGGIEDIKLLADSALIIGRENQQAIFANRYTIIQQIQKDTSLTRDEAFELLQPFLDGIKDLKRNNGWTPYVNE